MIKRECRPALPGPRLLPAMLWLLLALGCSRAPIMINKYILEYPAPPATRQAPIPEAIKIQEFAATEAYNTTAMLYRPDAYRRQAYVYNQWRVTPGPLVTDCLVRDLRHAGLFKAVFTGDSLDRARFRVEGGVTEIQENNEPGGWEAVLAVSVTLLDTAFPSREVSKRVVFQKSYRASEPLVEHTPQGLARGISQAMARLSREIISDIYRASRERLAAQEPPPAS